MSSDDFRKSLKEKELYVKRPIHHKEEEQGQEMFEPFGNVVTDRYLEHTVEKRALTEVSPFRADMKSLMKDFEVI